MSQWNTELSADFVDFYFLARQKKNNFDRKELHRLSLGVSVWRSGKRKQPIPPIRSDFIFQSRFYTWVQFVVLYTALKGFSLGSPISVSCSLEHSRMACKTSTKAAFEVQFKDHTP